MPRRGRRGADSVQRVIRARVAVTEPLPRPGVDDGVRLGDQA